ncbi:MAG: hypothetical protein KatS3mg009_2573 [Acidimicrobiia bacterium]|nr:MAG: hypothetical protein KatS3mg009_2573 [Acidimicrobiia bacterium]
MPRDPLDLRDAAARGHVLEQPLAGLEARARAGGPAGLPDEVGGERHRQRDRAGRRRARAPRGGPGRGAPHRAATARAAPSSPAAASTATTGSIGIGQRRQWRSDALITTRKSAA